MWFFFTWSLCLQLCFCSNPSNSASDFAWIMWGLCMKGQNASCPRCGLSTWIQGTRVNSSYQKYNLHLFPSDCAESKSYHPSAPPEQHWLVAVPWCAQVWQREPEKVTLEGKRHGKLNICHSQMKLQASCPRQRGRNKWKSKHICNYRGMQVCTLHTHLSVFST